MKRTLCILLLMFLFCGCATTNTANSANAKKFEPIYKSLDSFGGETSDDVIEFIHNPRDNRLYPSRHIICRFEEHNGQLLITGISSEDGSKNQGPFLALDDPKNIWQKFTSSTYCQQAITFLCDEDAIRQCFRENGVENIQKFIIINLDGMGNEIGYVITAITETQAYFMTVPLSDEKYGDYIFQKVYTQEEFLKIFGPRPAKVFINENEIAFSTTPLLGYAFFKMDLFAFLDALDAGYTFDAKLKTITIDDVIVKMKEFEDGLHIEEILKGGELVGDIGQARHEDGKYIGNIWLYIELIPALGYHMDFYYDDYSVRIVKR